MVMRGWPWLGLALALFALLVGVVRGGAWLRDPRRLVWIGLPLYMLHQFEEHGIDLTGHRFAFQAIMFVALGVSFDQAKRPFGTRHDTKTAGFASVETRRVRREAAMDDALHFAKNRKFRKVLIIDSANLENIVRTHFDAVAFAFAFGTIHDGHERSRLGATLRSGTLGVGCGALRLRWVLAGAHPPQRCRSARTIRAALPSFADRRTFMQSARGKACVAPARTSL